MRTRAATLLVWLALAGLLAGCAQTTVVGRRRVLRVSLLEYRMHPDRAQARRGELTIVARNLGRLSHNLVISSGTQVRGLIRPLGPGQSGQVTLRLGPGTYQLASTILSDTALGVYGTLEVTR